MLRSNVFPSKVKKTHRYTVALCASLLCLLPVIVSGCTGSAAPPGGGSGSSGGGGGTGGGGGSLPGLPNNRSTFVRTDDTPLAVVYDSVHNLIFASALHLNCVDVISVVTNAVMKCIPVSGPVGLSLSTDGSQVLVGTQTSQVARIDTGSLRIVERDSIPPTPQTPNTIEGLNHVIAAEAYQTSNGKLLLFSNWGFMDLSGNFQSAALVEWDPTAGTSTLRTDSGGGGLVSMSADHSKVLIAGQGTPTVYDAATDTFTPVPGVSGVFEPAMNPAGTQFALLDGTPLIQFFNAQMNVVGSLNLNICCGFRPAEAVYSPDGRDLYVVLPGQVPALVTIDASTFQVVGESPSYTQGILNDGGHPQAADASGLIFELADHGVAIDDATNIQNLANVTQPPSGIVRTSPVEGPLNTRIPVSFSIVPAISNALGLFFGSQSAQSVTGVEGSNNVQATAPPSGKAGPVNLKIIEPTGGMSILPSAFTYGSSPVAYGTLASGPQGGVTTDVFGYGFSIDVQNSPIQVKVGNQVASVNTELYFTNGLSGPYPFPLQDLGITIPPAANSGAEDITISSPAGSAVIPKGFHYLSGVRDYSSPDTFTYLLVDPNRNQIYLSAGNHVDVFSLNSQSFAAPIAVPSLTGAYQLEGLALTPDHSKLLVANQADQSIAIINADNPTSGAVAVQLPLSGMAGNPGPFEIAATSTNKAFITITVGNVLSGGGSTVYMLDLSTLKVTAASLPAGSLLNLNNNYIQGSADGTLVVVATSNNSAGPLIMWHASTNSWQVYQLDAAGFQFWSDAAVSADGNVVAVNSDPEDSTFPFPYLLDPKLNLAAQVNFPEFESTAEGPSLQLEQSGSLLYAVTAGGVDIMDARTGQLRERVLLPEQILFGPTEQLQTPAKTMAISPTGSEIFLLTTAGLTVVDLDTVPLGIGSVTPSSGAAGSTVKVRGTGFAPGTVVSANGIQATASFVDASTLQVTLPSSLPKGATQFVITNPDGSTFSFDSAFLVQ